MIYVCIPVHDEAQTVGVLLWKVRRVMAEFGRDYRILVLDDASQDATPDVLARYRRVLPLTVERAEQRLGYAGAVERLLRRAVDDSGYPKRDVVVVLQADFTDDPEDLVGLVKTIEGGADVVAGVATAGDAALPRSLRVARWVAPWVLGARRGWPVSDPLTSYRAYRLIVLKKVLRDRGEDRLMQGEGWAANVELLSLVAPHARRIEESPVRYRHPLRVRPSRFRAVPEVRGLFAVRGTATALREVAS